MGQTAVYQLPWPELAGSADGPSGLQALAQATEAALARRRGWWSRRNATDDIPASMFGENTRTVATDAIAGDYLLTAVVYWFSGNQTGESVYTWLRFVVNGSEVGARSIGGISGNANDPLCAVHQHMHGHTGGTLTVISQFGFATRPVRVFNGSTVSAIRVTN